MANVEELFVTGMLANAALSAALSTRLWGIEAVMNPSYPYAVFQRISTNYLQTNDLDTDKPNAGWVRMQMTIVDTGANSSISTGNIAKLVRQAIKGFSCCGSGTNQAPNLVLTESKGVEPNTQPPLFTHRMDLQVWFKDE